MTTVRCPICLSLIDWSAAEEVVMDATGAYETLQRAPHEDDIQWNHRRLNAFRMCPGSGTRHALPGRYGDFGEPLVIGMVGEGFTGKTHLLAAMIGMLSDAERMSRIGLVVSALDLGLHQQYLKETVRPFLDEGRGLPGTRAAPPEFTDALWVHNRATGRDTALAFFDVSGEWLANHDAETPFLGAVNGLIFVVDPTRIRRTATGEGGAVVGDPSFTVILDKLARIRGFEGTPFLPVPAAVVIAKCDLLRHHEELVGRWFNVRAEDEEELDLSTVEQESEDAYAFLRNNRAGGWLAPFVRCADSTLHFATATGTKGVRDEEQGVETFPLDLLRPRRTLKPLLSLLAMSGVLDRGMFERRTPR